MDETAVVAYRSVAARYPSEPPFHPAEGYPESLFPGEVGREENHAYAAVRGALALAGLDAARRGTPLWNPLREFVGPGQFVVLKPNLIKEEHPRDREGWIYTLTHGSVIRAVADFAWKAVEGRGRVMIADAPQTDSSFDRMVRLLGLDSIRDFYAAHGLTLELVDLRREEWLNREGVIVERAARRGDPSGYVAFDLGQGSEFAGHGGIGRYYGADYDEGEVNRHHEGGRHEYLVSGSVIRCDLFVNLPKWKTHKKAGITVSLKNLVGVNGDKNWLPHHTVGYPENGGDQYPAATLGRRLEHHSSRLLRRAALRSPALGTWLFRRARRIGGKVFGETSKVVRSGNWHGNDTTWRMCLDLNKIVLYGNSDGTLRPPGPSSRKAYLSLVDGLIAGHGDGPVDPDPFPAGTVLLGRDPALVDSVAAVMMGFEPERIPITRQAFMVRDHPIASAPPDGARCLSNHAAWDGPYSHLKASPDRFRFRPHFGWIGRIESAR
jgi:uncharacterized protein (DUF362 family)